MLITCKECGKEVSDSAKRCPNCGAKVKKVKVEKEKKEKGNLLAKIAEKVAGSKKTKWAYFISMIASCAIAGCFLLMTLLSFAAPLAFLHSEPCRDGYDLIEELAPDYDGYEITIHGSSSNYTYKIMGLPFSGYVTDVCVTSSISGSSFAVHRRFKPNGSVEAIVTFTIGYFYECEYVYDGSYAELVQAYKGYSSTTLTNTEREYAYSLITLTDTVLNYVLSYHSRDYDFDDILEDYADYHNSLLGIRISSAVIMVVFTTISIFAIVFYAKIRKKRGQTAESLQEETSDALNGGVNELSQKAVNEAPKEKTKANNEMAVADALKLYKELLDSGVITQEEFDKKKSEIFK